MSEPQPPQPPEIKRQFHLYPVQMIGLGLLLLFVVAALLNLLGDVVGEAQAAGDPLEIQVEYPQRVRYGRPTVLQITVTNSGEQPLDVVTVRLSWDYLDHFQDITFTPSDVTITPDAYEIQLTDLGAGESQMVTIEMKAAEGGSYSANVQALIEDVAATEVRLQTLIFP